MAWGNQQWIFAACVFKAFIYASRLVETTLCIHAGARHTCAMWVAFKGRVKGGRGNARRATAVDENRKEAVDRVAKGTRPTITTR